MNTCVLSVRITLFLLLFASPWVGAGGIYVDSQNAVGVGNANAGASALGEDASTVFYNPAGMARLPQGQHFAGVMTYAQVDTRFEDRGSTTVDAVVPLGARKSAVSRDAWVPALYWVSSPSIMAQVGIGLSPTFGNAGEWGEDFIGRYQGSDTTIEGFNLNPSVAFALSPQFSVGAGVNYLYLEAELVSRVPVLIDGSAQGDGELKMKGRDGGWGYNVGIMAQVSPRTRIGLTYRSTIKLNVKGAVDVNTSVFDQRIPGQLHIEMPDMASLGLVQTLSDQWQVLLDLGWFGWSTVSSIDVRERPTGTLLQSDDLHFDNGMRVGLGFAWRPSSQWLLRGGVALDTTVASKAEYLSTRFPDNDRQWLAVGGQYTVSPGISVDFAYSHGFVDDARIDRVTTLNNTPTAQTVRGVFSSAADMISLQWNQRF